MAQQDSLAFMAIVIVFEHRAGSVFFCFLDGKESPEQLSQILVWEFCPSNEASLDKSRCLDTNNKNYPWRFGDEKKVPLICSLGVLVFSFASSVDAPKTGMHVGLSTSIEIYWVLSSG